MKSAYKFFSAVLCFLVITACGGGGGGTSGDDTTSIEDAYTIDLSLQDESGNAITEVTQTIPGVLTALVTKNAAPLANARVTFAIEGQGELSPSTASALTDASGLATISILSGNEIGTGTVTAEYVSDSGTISTNLSYSARGYDYTLALTVVDSSGDVHRDITQASPGSVVATLLRSGVPAEFETIEFTVIGEGIINPSSGSALTNTDGEAKVTLVTDTVAGAGTLTATFTLGEENITETFNYSVAGDAPGGDGEANKLSIILTNNLTGEQTDTISAAAPGRVIITLVDKDDDALEGKVVSFASTLGGFLPLQGTALTNSGGQASIVITAGSVEGAGEITASYGATQALIGFTTAGDEIDPVEASPVIAFDIYDCQHEDMVEEFDKALKNFEVCVATDNITNNSPGIIGATITRSGSTQPLQQVLVSAVTTLGGISPNSGTAITNANGKAVLDLYSDGDVGAGEVTLQVQEVTSTKAFEIGRVDISLEIDTELGGDELPAGGSTIVNVTVLDPDDELETSQPFSLEFTSQCVAAGTAFIDSPVVTNAGRGFTTYRAAGCEGNDTITVSAVTGGGAVNADVIVNVGAVDIGSLQFISAEPELLAMRGTGGLAGAGSRTETSNVTFRLLDESAQPAPGEKVCFELSNELGGTTLSPSPRESDYADCANMPQLGDADYPTDFDVANKYAVAFTDADGDVTVTVHAGDVATPVKVFGLWSGSNTEGHNGIISNVSSSLAITTGIADNDSFSLSASILNPEGWNFDNETIDVTTLAADHFNNLVPAGTTMTFRTEGGAIDATCSTGTKTDGVSPNGACSVTWRSQDPRPFAGTAIVCPNGGFNGSTTPPCHGTSLTLYENGVNSVIAEPRPGRATVTAYAIGEESFVDLNGNGLFDTGEPYGDISEAFTDHNRDGAYRDAVVPGITPAGAINEEFVDYNSNGSFDEADGFYTGLLCAAGSAAACTDTGTDNNRNELNVFRNITVVMAGSVPFARATNIAADGDTISLAGAVDLTNAVTTDDVVYLFISDVNNNTLPFGTEINASTDNGVLNPANSTYTIGSNSGARPALYSFAISAESTPNQRAIGSLVITAKTPLGSTYTVATITVIDAG